MQYGEISSDASSEASSSPGGSSSSLVRTDSLASGIHEDTPYGHNSAEFRLSNLVLTDPDIFRGTTAAVPLERLGALLSADDHDMVARGHSEDTYDRSFVVEELDEFWSHSWSGPFLDKMATLLLYYNGHVAYMLGMFGAFVGAVFSWSVSIELPLLLSALTTLLLGLCCFLFGLFFFRSQRRVFLDRVCISQADQQLKSQGIRSIGGVLRYSKTLLILWDRTHFSRLWCVFEQAAFYRLQALDATKRIHIRPTIQGTFVLVLMATNLSFVLVTIAHLSIAGYTDVNAIAQDPALRARALFTVGVSQFWSLLPASHLCRRFARDAERLSRDFDRFSVRGANCFCCSNDHVHPDTNVPMTCDRAIVEMSICRWFGSLDDFDAFLHSLKPKYVVSASLPYLATILIASPQLWAMLGVIAWKLRVTGRTCAADWSSWRQADATNAIIVGLSYVLIFMPLSVEFVVRSAKMLSTKGMEASIDMLKSIASTFVASASTTAMVSIAASAASWYEVRGLATAVACFACFTLWIYCNPERT